MLIANIKSLFHSKTFRNGGLFSIFSFFNRGVSFLLMVILADYILPEQYGELSLFNTITTFIGYIIGFSTAGFLSVSYFKETKEQFRKDLTSIFLVTVLGFMLLVSIYALFCEYLSEALKISGLFLLLGISISLANVFTQLNLDYLRVQEAVVKYGLLSCSYALLNFTVSIYFVTQLDLNWHGRVYAQISTELIFAVIALIWFYKDKLFVLPDSFATVKRIIVWGLPLIPHHASIWMKQGLDRYIIDGTHTMADVGLFSFAMNLAGVLIMIGIAFNQTNSVALYQTLSSNLSPNEKLGILHRKEKFIWFIYLMAMILIVVVGSIMIPIIIPNYSDSVPYFVILTIYGFFQCVYFLFCNYLFYYNKNHMLMYITFGMSVMHLLLSLLLTRYSLYFTCFIYVVTQILVCTFVYIQSQRCIKISIGR